MGADEPVTDLGRARRDVGELRRALQEGVAVETDVTSVDGRTFTFRTPLGEPVPLAGFVVVTAEDGRRYLGQVTDRGVAERPGARVTVDVPEFELGIARASQAEIELEQRMTVGAGTLLARFAPGGELAAPSLDDVFDGAALAHAEPADVERYLASLRREAAALDVGWSPFAGPEVRTALNAGGFNRHTFLCGQSGSGKTFSLGVILERLLLDTSLRMIVVDPNSDFVHLGQLRSHDSYNRSVAIAVGDDEYARLAARYRASVEGLRVLRPGGEQPLTIRFSELTSHEQAAVLKLDALGDRAEFAAFRRIAERLAGSSYSLADVQQEALATLQEDSRQVGLRVANLGAADWGVWAGAGDAALGDHLAADWRGLVLDVGGLASGPELSVVAMSLLGRLWRRREERQPVMVVIDEAHNVCPADPEHDLQALATEHVVRIAGEGRKFGIYLLLSTQRPQKLHPNVLSQCDNLVLMRMNSRTDVDHLAATFSFVPPALLAEATGFTLGQALVAGKISPTPAVAQIEGRLSVEGGGDVAATWAVPARP